MANSLRRHYPDQVLAVAPNPSGPLSPAPPSSRLGTRLSVVKPHLSIRARAWSIIQQQGNCSEFVWWVQSLSRPLIFRSISGHPALAGTKADAIGAGQSGTLTQCEAGLASLQCIRAVHLGLVSFGVRWLSSGRWLRWDNITVEGGARSGKGRMSVPVQEGRHLDGVPLARVSRAGGHNIKAEQLRPTY